MPVIESKIDANSAQFKQNREDLFKANADWRWIEEKGRAEEKTKHERSTNRGPVMPPGGLARASERSLLPAILRPTCVENSSHGEPRSSIRCTRSRGNNCPRL